MNDLSTNRSAAERLDTFVKSISSADISRWVKWDFCNQEKTTVGYQVLQKQESKAINRLLDRLNSENGKARHAARLEIIDLLKNNGLEVTENIKKYLPDTYKLGNAADLSLEIKSLISKKSEEQAKLSKEIPSIIKNYLKDFISEDDIPRNILRNKSDAKIQFISFMRPMFEERITSFVANLLKKLSGQISPLIITENEIKGFIDKEINEFFRDLTNSDEWKAIKEMFEKNIEEALNELESANKITSGNAKNFLKSAREQSVSILTFAGLNGFLADAVVKNAENFKKIFHSLTNINANDQLTLLIGYVSEGLNRETKKN